jgi:glutathione synthase/RimK-type ligase-like ATP-grasp enzyme
MILILTDIENDSHAEYVSNELSRRGESVQLYNPGTYPLSSKITVEYVNRKLTYILPNSNDNYLPIDLQNLKSIWYRKPTNFNLSTKLKSEETEWLKQECSHLFNAMWANLHNIFWVSKPENIRKASLKLFQLHIASQLGFRIPRSIVTNDIKQAESFIKYNKEVVVKTLASPFLYNPERVAEIYTHLLTKDDLKYLFSVEFGPTFLQQFIHKTMDIRVTVIGESLFAAAIDSVPYGEAKVDFRRSKFYNLPHKPVELPKTIKHNCIKLVKKLGLRFGAIDLLLTAKGNYFFLEINPNGQWLWIEETTGMPLTEAMCNLLSSH